jgi:hypothetical protein
MQKDKGIALYSRCSLGRLVLAFLSFSMLPLVAGTHAPQDYLVRDGRAQAQIIIGDNASPFYQFVAGELKRYIFALTGASLDITRVSQAGRNEGSSWILLGGPGANGLVQKAAANKLVDFSGLKQDDFLLWSVRLRGHNALLVGGNDEPATMYAAYDLVERLGVTFLLSKDFIPERTSDLQMPSLRLRLETPFPRRGLFIASNYQTRSIWSLADVKSFLDQMAKLKFNYLQFFWFEHEPWLDFEFRGEHKLLGDATGKETGYMGWRYQFGSYLIKDLPVGQEHFQGRQRLAPPEFQNVETPGDAFRVAKDFLTEVIRYAETRKIKVWLCIDPTTLPGNLARFGHRASNEVLPFNPILGVDMCPADPELHEINENRLRALIADYPEAEGYFLWFPEPFPECKDDLNRNFLMRERAKYEAVMPLWADYYRGDYYEIDPSVVLDSTTSTIYIMKKMLEARDRIAPRTRLGIGAFGRGFVLPLLDRMLPKDVPFISEEARTYWTFKGVPMQQIFGGMGERERLLQPRLNDDSDAFGMQFNVGLFYKDRVLEGSLESGVTGFAGYLDRVRGMEQNSRYLAEGAWRPHLTPTEFYREYSRRLFGSEAAKDMLAAFEVLEQNEEAMGWRGANFFCCGPIPEVETAHWLYTLPNPFDGPAALPADQPGNPAAKWERFITGSHDRIQMFNRNVELLTEALKYLNDAAPKVAPRGREDLKYLQIKTEAYVLHLQTLIALRQGYVGLDEAFHRRGTVPQEQFVRLLDQSLEAFTTGRKLGRRATEKFAEIIDYPSDLGVLYRANLFLVTGTELAEQTIRNIVNYHHGRDYVQEVSWGKIYHDFPQFRRGGGK